MRKKTQTEAFIPPSISSNFCLHGPHYGFWVMGANSSSLISKVKGIFQCSNETKTALGQSVHAKLGSAVTV